MGWLIILPIFAVLAVILIIKLRSRDSGSAEKGDAIPVDNRFASPYVFRQFTEDMEKYMEGEQLYLSGQHGKAKVIWNRLAKNFNIDAIHAMICYYLNKNEPLNALKYSTNAHGYAAFNLGLIYYRAVENIQDSENCSFKMNPYEIRAEHQRNCTQLKYVGYFRTAAMQNVPEAQYNLGFIYQNGILKKQFSFKDEREKNLYLALYWYYRGAMQGHGGCIRGLCEVYKELLPVCDEWVTKKFEKAIGRLEKWMAENTDKLGEKKMILKHFDLTYHEKYECFHPEKALEDAVREAVALTGRSVSRANLSVDSKDNTFTFDRYSLQLDSIHASDSEYRIAKYIPKIVFKGKGEVIYGTVMTKDRNEGIYGLELEMEKAFKEQLKSVIEKNPYCVLAFEDICCYLVYGTKLTKQALRSFFDIGFSVSLDSKGISSEKFVYVTKSEAKADSASFVPEYFSNVSASSDSEFSYASLFFNDSKTEYYYKNGLTENKMTQDVSNPNIYYDSAGNKFYTGNNGDSFTKL